MKNQKRITVQSVALCALMAIPALAQTEEGSITTDPMDQGKPAGATKREHTQTRKKIWRDSTTTTIKGGATAPEGSETSKETTMGRSAPRGGPSAPLRKSPP